MASDFQHAKAAFDAKVRQEFRSIPIPADLRDKILTHAPVRAPATNILRPAFWRPALAVAAALVLLATAVLLLRRPPSENYSYEGFRDRMVSFAVRQYSMDFHTSKLEDVRLALANGKAPSDFTLSDGLRNAPVKGGAKLSWQGHPVSMVCFDGPDARTLYLFIVESTSVPDAPSQTNVVETKGLASASWTRDGKSYLLAADLPPERLRSYL